MHTRRRAPVFVGMVVVALGACTVSAPTPFPPELPLVACQRDAQGVPTAPPDYVVVAPGTILFTQDAWHNLTPADHRCGAQAVRGAASTFDLSSMEGEDGIMWVATLARPGAPAVPEAARPSVSLFRVDATGQVPVPIDLGETSGVRPEQYRMLGNYGHDAVPGSYLMRIVSSEGTLLAEGSFTIVP